MEYLYTKNCKNCKMEIQKITSLFWQLLDCRIPKFDMYKL